MDIEYRTYEPGDESGLADVFNYAFQSNGGGFLRTPKSITWRYRNRPGGKPQEIVLAVDKDKQKIVSCLYATIEHYFFQGQCYTVGSINDVGTLPSYTGQGISKKLMARAIDFMASEGCDYSALVADPNGHPRKKIYSPAGYEDYCKQVVWFNFTNPVSAVRYLPPFLPLFPALAVRRGISAIWTKFGLDRLKTQGIIFKIFHPDITGSLQMGTKLGHQLCRLLHDAGTRQYDAFEPFEWDEWRYFRVRPNQRGLYPSFAVAFHNEEPVGFTSLTRQWMYVVKAGIHFPLAFMRDIVVDHAAIGGKVGVSLINDIYTGLAMSISTAAYQRRCGMVVINSTPTFRLWNRGMRAAGVIEVPAYGTFMLKRMKSDLLLPPKTGRPVVISSGESFCSP